MTVRAVLAGYYGAGNAGDEAILDGMLGELRAQVPGLDVVVVSGGAPHTPCRTRAACGVASISKTDKQALLTAVRDCDLVILGGGGLLQDYWGMEIGDLFRPGVPASYSTYAAFAALFDKPLVLYGIGVGPLATSEGRRWARLIAEEARLITVRDAESKALLEEVGVDGGRIHVTADPAFRMAIRAADLGMDRPVLGVAIRNWNVGVNSEAWEAELAAALEGFLDRTGGSILFLPFECKGAGAEDDVAAARQMQLRVRLRERTAVFEPAGDPAQLAGAIAACDAVVAMRYHAALFAIRWGIPVAGLIYDPKIRHLFTAAGAEKYTIDVSALRADDLLARIEQALQDAGLPGRLRAAADRLAEAAAENAGRVAEAMGGGFSWAPPVATTRMWLDELTAATSGGNGFRDAIARRRRELRFRCGATKLYDVICFPGIEWNFRWMRAQQLMSQFADRGHRVFFISTAAFLPPEGVRFRARSLRGNVWEVRLATPQAVEVYSGVMPDDVQLAIGEALSGLARAFEVSRAVSMLHLATWAPAAYDLRARFGWPVVYDCMDDWSGFAWMPDALIEGEIELVRQAQLVVTSAQKLWDRWSALNRHTILARNAADMAHFQKVTSGPAIDLPESRKIVGFFGAIDSWFDIDLIRRAARERPDYFFALIGAVYDAPVESLQELPNVRLFGYQPYAALPAWLERFDACVIPFKINAVTEATDPVKFYEYLAQGKPVVATRLPELEIYREVVYLADGADDFIRQLDAAVSERDHEVRERRLAIAGENTWTARYEQIDRSIQETFPATPAGAACGQAILFVCPVLILGGVEVILKTRSTELLRRGFQVRLLSMEEAGGRMLFENSGIDSRICPGEAEFAAELADFQPDWIVILDAPAMVPAARRAAPQASIIYEVHSTYSHILAPLVDRDIVSGVRGIMVPSASQRERVRSLLAVEKPIEIVPNALTPAFFEEAGPATEDGRPIVLWVGRLDSLKNWRAFVEIAVRLSDLTPAEFHLISAGPFAESEGTELRLAAEGLEGRLHWIREVHPTQMPDLYHATAQSGGCLVSTSAAESFGMAVLEAMACRCPVVAPDIEGLRDLVRPNETGWLYPAGDIAAACGQVIHALHDPPERRQRMTESAHQVARQFSQEAATERFLAALATWSAPPDAPRTTSPQEPGLAPAREELARILAGNPEAQKVVIFPPSLPWNASVAGRPQEWARALAAHGCLVFYCDPQYSGVFIEVEPRLVVANVSLEVYSAEMPVVMANAYNLAQLGHFRDPVVVYEWESSGNPSVLEEEWLARSAVVIVDSEELRQAIAGRRPDALLVPAIDGSGASEALLSALQDAATWEKDPVRLKTLLAWRERQVDRLEAQIRERDRPAVDLLHGAVNEQKRIISERDKGIAFLRREVASRDRIIAEREAAIAFLQAEVSHRESANTARIEEQQIPRDALAAAEEGIRFLRQEVAARDQIIAARDQDIAFLRQEVENREEIVAARDQDLALVRQTIATAEEGIQFLRQEVEQRDRIIAARDQDLELLRRELAERDRMIADLESRLTWWGRRKWHEEKRERGQ